MSNNPFYDPNHRNDPEQQQLINREFLHRREQSGEGNSELARLAYRGQRYSSPALRVTIGRLKLDNPLIVAAGWDKFGEAVKGLYALGFGGVEVGTIPLYPQAGNPKARHFIPRDGVMLNRYGFNSPGAAVVKQNLQRYRHSNIPIGINIGKNKTIGIEQAPAVHAQTAELLYDEAAYFVINVSSPNTPDVRSQQAKPILAKIAAAVQAVVQAKATAKPIFVKVAPELTPSELADVVEVVIAYKLEGIIASNTTTNPSIKAKYGKQWQNEPGGLSGDDHEFRTMVDRQIRFIYRLAKGSVSIIRTGGIKDVSTALTKIKAGASALQIMSALNFSGPTLPGVINLGLAQYLEAEGVKSLNQLTGVDA